MKRILYLWLSLPLWVHAQGIRFVDSANWQEILAKAKEEQKFIFVDCYATWCGPCKLMEREVFPKKDVGDFMNVHFISVRVQMDTSHNDGYEVQSWYPEAHRLRQEYDVKAFPTYLFFSPEGKIVHQYLYAMHDSLFLKMAASALDSGKQYYRQLAGYFSGRRDYEKMRGLAMLTQQIGGDSISRIIANDYLHHYMDTLPDSALCQRQQLDFANAFSSLIGSNDRVFKLLYLKGDHADRVMETKGFASNFVEYVITREEIGPLSASPDWGALEARIRRKYNPYYTRRVMVDAQLGWYTQKNDWPKIIHYTVARWDQLGLDTAGIGWAYMNNAAYELFLEHCNNRDTLNKMIRWMEIIRRSHPDDYHSLDTYANLLYKTGRKKEAIEWEEKVVQLNEVAARQEGKMPSIHYKEVLEKMRKGCKLPI